MISDESFQYSLNKAQALLATRDPDWDQHLVAELDSALNQWVDAVPEHRARPLPQSLLR